MFSALVDRIVLYPIKSLDGVDVQQVEVLPSGALKYDRGLAIVDQQGNFVNGKRQPAVHGIRSSFDLSAGTVQLTHAATQSRFEGHLTHDRDDMARWLSDQLGFEVRVVEDTSGGFPDDSEAPGPTMISTQSLARVASWFSGMETSEARRRFRANIELKVSEPFAEDALFGVKSEFRPIAIGKYITLGGTNPCQRCAVPTRDSETGEVTALFQKTFSERREAELPAFAERSRFNHFYRLAVNTLLLDRIDPGTIQVGDPVQVR